MGLILERPEDCQRTWPSNRPALIDEPDRYRQHRCGLPASHQGRERCRCRYCKETR